MAPRHLIPRCLRAVECTPINRGAHVAFVRNGLRFHSTSDLESKYAEKLRRKAEEAGLSIVELKEQLAKRPPEKIVLPARLLKPTVTSSTPASSDTTAQRPAPLPVANVRKDSSPVKPLSSILNIPRILSTPHTPEQISALWSAYHISRSGGTGRGYVCASIPLDLYKKMADVAGKYPTFVVPLPRVNDLPSPEEAGEEKTAYEFYFLQWGTHESPPVPSEDADPFTPPKTAPLSAGNPPISTVLFTPLQEYKQRASFATPYLVLTHYTDLAHTHGVVLLRGEITPAAATGGQAAADGRYMLSQADAQLLSLAVQKFYLWSQGSGREEDKEGEKLLKTFHESPEEFQWKDLLKHASFTA